MGSRPPSRVPYLSGREVLAVRRQAGEHHVVEVRGQHGERVGVGLLDVAAQS